MKLQGWCRKWGVGESKYRPLQSFYSIIRKSKEEEQEDG